FRPYTDFPRFLKRVVIPFDGFLAVVCHRKVITLKVHAQAVPYVWAHFHAGALLLGALAIDGVIDRDIVFQGIGPRDVIVVRVLEAPDQPAGLVFFAGDRLEFHFDEAVLQTRVILEADRKCRSAGLLQHVRFARRSFVLFDGPLRVTAAGLGGRPAGGHTTDGRAIEVINVSGWSHRDHYCRRKKNWEYFHWDLHYWNSSGGRICRNLRYRSTSYPILMLPPAIRGAENVRFCISTPLIADAIAQNAGQHRSGLNDSCFAETSPLCSLNTMIGNP